MTNWGHNTDENKTISYLIDLTLTDRDKEYSAYCVVQSKIIYHVVEVIKDMDKYFYMYFCTSMYACLNLKDILTL